MKLFLTVFGILTTSEIHLFAAEAGMPQLDPTYWASQAFWLILIFIALYLNIPFLAYNNKQISDNKIKDDLDEAQKLKSLAEQKLKEYGLSIENAKKEIHKIIFESKKNTIKKYKVRKKNLKKKLIMKLKLQKKQMMF